MSEAEVHEAEVLPAVRDDLEVVEHEREIAEPPRTVLPSPVEWEAMRAVAKEIAKTEFVPKELRGRPEAVLAAIMAGREIGIGPMEALRQIHIIDGRPVFSASLMLSLMRRGGLAILRSESTMEHAFIHAVRRDTGEEAEVEWTYAEAEQIVSAKGGRLVEKDNWKNYRADMLWARCVGRLARRLGSDLLGGMVYSSEEVADWEEIDGEYETGNGSTPQAPAKPKNWRELLDAYNRDFFRHPWNEWWNEAAKHTYKFDYNPEEPPLSFVLASIEAQKGKPERDVFWQKCCQVYAKIPRSDLGPNREEVRRAFYEVFGVVCQGPQVTMDAFEADLLPTMDMRERGERRPANVVTREEQSAASTGEEAAESGEETGPSDTTPSEESDASGGVTAGTGLGEDAPVPSDPEEPGEGGEAAVSPSSPADDSDELEGY